MLNNEVKESINDSVLCWLATVGSDGSPNVSPKEIFLAYGEKYILIANIASPRSVKNIKTNPAVCISFINIFTQKGFKVKGIGSIITPNEPGYEGMLNALCQLIGDKFSINSIIQITVQKVSEVLAPSYKFYPEITEKSQIDSAMKSYGVKPEADT